jgi:hypothetical protein
MSSLCGENGAEKSGSSVQGSGWLRMFRVIAKHDMFDLQSVLLMCWINRVEHELSPLKQSGPTPHPKQ